MCVRVFDCACVIFLCFYGDSLRRDDTGEPPALGKEASAKSSGKVRGTSGLGGKRGKQRRGGGGEGRTPGGGGGEKSKTSSGKKKEKSNVASESRDGGNAAEGHRAAAGTSNEL